MTNIGNIDTKTLVRPTYSFLSFLGLVGPAVSLVILGLIDSSNRGAVIALLIIAVGINSAIYCGYQVNHIDIAPNHAGTLMGITNGAANILSICAPLLVQFVVTDEVNISVFCIPYRHFDLFSPLHYRKMIVNG